MIYLDTHVVVWLYSGESNLLSKTAQSLLNTNDLYISLIVLLELQYLYEIGRISEEAEEVISDLSPRIGLKICDKNFLSIISKATKFSWTRDPFDRIITANAALSKNPLLTKDENILKNYQHAQW